MSELTSPTPLEQLRQAREAILAEIDEDFRLMQLLTQRNEAREEILRSLDLAIMRGEEFQIGTAAMPPLRPQRRRGPKPGIKRGPQEHYEHAKFDPQRMAAAAALAEQELGADWDPASIGLPPAQA